MKSEVGWVRPGTEYTVETWVDWIPPKPADDADPRPLLVASVTRSPAALSSPPRFCDTGTAEGRRCSPASQIRRRQRLLGPVEPAVSTSLPAPVRACHRRSLLPAVLRSFVVERCRDPTPPSPGTSLHGPPSPVGIELHGWASTVGHLILCSQGKKP